MKMQLLASKLTEEITAIEEPTAERRTIDDKTNHSHVIKNIFQSVLKMLTTTANYATKGLMTLGSFAGIAVGGLLSAPFALIHLVLSWILKTKTIKSLQLGGVKAYTRKELENKFEELMHKKVHVNAVEITNDKAECYVLPDNFQQFIKETNPQKIILQGYTLSNSCRNFLEDEMNFDLSDDEPSRKIEMVKYQKSYKQVHFSEGKPLLLELTELCKAHKRVHCLTINNESRAAAILTPQEIAAIAELKPKKIICKNITGNAGLNEIQNLKQIIYKK